MIAAFAFLFFAICCGLALYDWRRSGASRILATLVAIGAFMGAAYSIALLIGDWVSR